VETVLQGVVIVGGSVLGALAAMMLVRRWVAVSALEAHSEVAGFVYAVLGVVYAVTLAFVVVVVWQQFETAKADTELKRALWLTWPGWPVLLPTPTDGESTKFC
jgi:hypothetical protein